MTTDPGHPTDAGRGELRIFDAHLHIIDPRFPLVANQGYVPEPFTVDDYRRATAGLGIAGGAVVSGSFQAFDQSYLVAALDELGDDFVGVTQLSAATPADRILELDRAGVRAVRFNLRRGGSASLDELESLAHRVHDLAGWHAELYVDPADLGELVPRIKRLPRASIDHLGLSREALPHLLELVEAGVHVKASGFGRTDLDVPQALRAIVQRNPDALVFGTDLPSTRAPRPFHPEDITAVRDALGDELARGVFWDNACALYRVPVARTAG